MNGAIRIRAWDKKNKVMLLPENKEFVNNFKLYPAGNYSYYGEYAEDWLEIMLSIGRKDKNGKEIFKWDIVEWKGVNGGIPGGKIGGRDVINYDIEEACFKFGNLSFIGDANQFNDNFPIYDEIEVIGNIFENPELCIKS